MTISSKQIIFNNAERAVSDDLNRLQKLQKQAFGDFAKFMFGVREMNADFSPGYITEYLAGALAPYQISVIVNGLMPYPINGTTDLLITAGYALMEDGSASSDDSIFAVCDSSGVPTIGSLTLTTSPTATRIDIVECRLKETTFETSNRDVYNPVTQLFTPTLVDKVKGGDLEFRIRTGSDGGGFPGVQTGWLPLAVVSVPSGATNWDACTIWDVRPLLSQAAKPPFIEWHTEDQRELNWPSASWDAGMTHLYMTGKVRAKLGPYDMSGDLGNYPTDSPWVDLADMNNWAAGAVPVANMPYYVWGMVPFSLPGWRKYSGIALSPRRPVGAGGVLAVSPIAPTTKGMLSLPISPPTATGLGGSTTFAMLLAAGWVDGTSVGQPFASDGDWTYITETSNIYPGIVAPASGGSSFYDLPDNVYHPANAKSVKLSFLFRWYDNIAPYEMYVSSYIYLVDPVTNTRIALLDKKEYSRHSSYVFGSYYVITPSMEVEIPMRWLLTLVGNRRIEVLHLIGTLSGSTPTNFQESANLIAWKMTP